MRRAALVTAVLAAALAIACGSENSLEYFGTALKPENEVPARTSTGTGTLRLSFDGTTFNYTVVGSDLANVTQGHIHSGAAGVNGPVRVFLLPLQNPPISVGPGVNILAQGSFTAADMVGGFSFSTLVEEMRAGTAYGNFHTTTYPGGEIRGQLRLLN